MVNLPQFKDYINDLLEKERQKEVIEIKSPTIKDALGQAAMELSCSVKNLEYEVIINGSSGVFGLFKRDYTLLINKIEKKKDTGFMIEQSKEGPQEASEQIDGEFFVHRHGEKICLKVTAAGGKGKKVKIKDVETELQVFDVQEYDKNLLKEVIKEADGEYQPIADYHREPENDATVAVEIPEGEMRATITLYQPRLNGSELDYNAIYKALVKAGVVFGVDEELIKKYVDNPRYGKPIVVAKGQRAVDGADSRIEYLVNLDPKKSFQDVHGQVDYKNTNVIVDVLEGQIIANFLKPEPGRDGSTVTNRTLIAKNGKEENFTVGKNVRVTADGSRAIAEKSGQLVMVNGKMAIESLYVVDGSVNYSSGGNIIHLGSVLIKGSVEDGFSVKSSGNIEIKGNVGKAVIEAEGSVIIHTGISGKGEGLIKAGGSVFSRFIESAVIDSHGIVFANEGIINSKIIANEKIICFGKRAMIIGGRLQTGSLIYAKDLGSYTGVDTYLEVECDADIVREENKLLAFSADLQKKYDLIKYDINQLNNEKEESALPPEREEEFKKLQIKELELSEELKKTAKEMQIIKNKRHISNGRGTISASERAYSKLTIKIGEAELHTNNETEKCTFVKQDDVVNIIGYENIEEELKKIQEDVIKAN